MFRVKTCSRYYCFSWLLLCLVFGCLTLSCLTPIYASAFANPIQVTAQTDQVNFPKSIDFQMTAHDAAGTLTQATIFIQFKGIDEDQEQHAVTAPEAGNIVTFHWHEDTTGGSFTPTGTQISYYWLVQDDAGNRLTDTAQAFTVIDPRFTWQHATQGLLQVNWYNHPAAFGQTILQLASTNVNRISHDLGNGLKKPISVWIYQSDEDFHNSLPPNTNEWVGGIAFPNLDVASIVVNSYSDYTLTRDMPHELTHLIFHQVKSEDVQVPRWFDEGLAVYEQTYHEPEMSTRLQKGLDQHALLRLNDITYEFPADADKAYLAYAESWNLLGYMYTTFGHTRMATLMKDLGNPRTDFNQDLRQALGVDEAHLENQWHLYLHQPPILTASQASTTSSLAVQSIHATAPDSTAQFLLVLGVLLVILPALGIAYLLSYQHRQS
ncbi:MAG TPA: peptidase MA family metallohydrolase [Ktedonobacteraceae bacterium]|jgi:hypothetical protein